MSRKRTFTTAETEPRTFEFDMHSDGCRDPHLAINVKCHHFPKATPENAPKLKALVEAGAVIPESALEDRIRENLAENWWEWARDLVAQEALGKMYCEGKSGGWLTLHDYSASRIEEICEDVEKRCKHCELDEYEHADGKCLFGATEYTEILKLTESSEARLRELQAFVAQIEVSLVGMAQAQDDEFDYQIQNHWDQHVQAEVDALEDRVITD